MFLPERLYTSVKKVKNTKVEVYFVQLKRDLMTERWPKTD